MALETAQTRVFMERVVRDLKGTDSFRSGDKDLSVGISRAIELPKLQNLPGHAISLTG